MLKEEDLLHQQLIPLFLTVVVFVVMVILLHTVVFSLNHFTGDQIFLQIRKRDIIIGLTIYLKTSIDFAIYIGHLMRTNPGWKNRIVIEIGTALGNAVGTFAILTLWDFFREIKILMAVMILLAALVLLKLAEEGLGHAKDYDKKFSAQFQKLVLTLEKYLDKINKAVAPVLKHIIPDLSLNSGKARSFKALFLLAFTVPFILGLDDFAGYVPLFNIVNVFGFSIGVLLGHMVLNIFLYLSPSRTIKAVKNPLISFAGSVFFVGLALWGFWEVVHLLA